MIDSVRGIGAWWSHFLSARPAVDRLYDLRGENAIVTDGDLPLSNMGYWAGVDPSAPDAIEQANLALYDLVVDAAAPDAETELVVDVGAGFGVGTVRCLELHRPRRVVGINLSRVQLQTARERARRSAFSHRICFLRADARCLPFADHSVDCLISVEAAFHFAPRDAFLAEAARVLKPGGKLSLVDLLALPPRGPAQRALLRSVCRGIGVPRRNVYARDEYRRRVERAGLAIKAIRSIHRDVYPPFRRWLLKQPPRNLIRYPLPLMLFSLGFLVYPWDYVQLLAVRP